MDRPEGDRRARGVGRHAGYRRRRDFRQRAFRRAADWRSRRIGASRGTRRRDARSFARRNGIRLRSKPLAENRRSAAVRCVPRVHRRSGGASRRGARVARVSQEDAAARHTERGLHFPESRSVGRACRYSGFCRRARRSGGVEGDVARRCPRVDDPWQFHRERRARHRLPRFARSSICAARACASSSASRCRKRSSTWETFDVESAD